MPANGIHGDGGSTAGETRQSDAKTEASETKLSALFTPLATKRTHSRLSNLKRERERDREYIHI